MTVEEKPDITYNDVGGCKEQIVKLREVVEVPLLHPERFTTLGIDPPKVSSFFLPPFIFDALLMGYHFYLLFFFILQGILLYGPPGTGKSKLNIFLGGN